MSNVFVDKSKIDLLANAISNKSGEPLTLTLDEMVEAVDGIEAGGGSAEPVLQAKTYTVDSAGTETITADSGYDGLSEVEINVPEASVGDEDYSSGFYNDGNTRKWRTRYWTDYSTGGFIDGVHYSDYLVRNAVPSNTTVTPTESSQTIGGTDYMMEGAVTVGAIPSNYIGSGITQRSSTDLTASGATVTVPSGYYSSQASKAVSSGTAGTPTATKGSVSNHSISVTPSVTNTSGYITGSTKTGTAVTVSASELVSGSETKTENGTYDVTNLAELVVDVQSGGSIAVDYKEASGTNTSSIAFAELSGQPTSFVIFSTISLSTGTLSKVATVVYDGTSTFADTITNTSNAQVTYVGNGFSFSYANGTLTITSAGESFTADSYVLAYTYGGNSVSTKDVQVGSGATSITFTGLEGAPLYWSCAFKSNFSTSSGYQRAITILNVAGATVGLAMDSAANYSDSYWTSSYSNGTLTITSQSANAGGYFHQPGYYQLTYAVDSSAPQYESVSKTYRASTSAQSDTIEPSSGYDAIEEVSVSIPAVTQTNLIADNIKSGTTISISNGQSNLWSVTGTYTGGGGSSGVKTGTLTVASNVNTSTSTQITTTTAIGFTPKTFIFYKSDRSATSNHVNQASFVTLGSSYYVRTMTRYSSNALATSGNTNNWTTQTAGYLYFNNNTIYFRSSSSYILPAGTWYWVAVE